MIVYHGSVAAVPHPDVLHSYRPLDFGKGFYVTSVREQAERWARRKADLTGAGAPSVNVYRLSEDFSGFSVKTFGEDLGEWIDFVCRCRAGEEIYLSYDLICGKVADDKVFRVVDLYRSGIWEKERALREIRAYETYDQLAFITQRAIDRLLVFEACAEV